MGSIVQQGADRKRGVLEEAHLLMRGLRIELTRHMEGEMKRDSEQRLREMDLAFLRLDLELFEPIVTGWDE